MLHGLRFTPEARHDILDARSWYADVAKELRRDYAAMSPLFMDEPPAFEELLARLDEIEARVNRGPAKLDNTPPGRSHA